MTLKASIHQTERSIAQRRVRLGVAIDGVRHAVRRRMVSPGALVTAGLLGAAMQRDHRLNGLRLLAVLEAANSGLRRLSMLFPPTGTPANRR